MLMPNLVNIVQVDVEKMITHDGRHTTTNANSYQSTREYSGDLLTIIAEFVTQDARVMGYMGTTELGIQVSV